MTYHLWRYYDTAPFRRWACTITEDSSKPDGYQVDDFDPAIADGTFLRRLHTHMLASVSVHRSVEEDGVILDLLEDKGPGEPGHFAAAIRTFSHGCIMPKGRDS